MAKKVSKFFRIGVEGDTCDGRVISAQDIQEMAETFDPRVYGCRINLEHLRGILPDGIFKRYGDVVELKAEKIDDDSALKGKWALFAKITPTDDLIAMNKAAQKVYTSMEIQPNFANTGKCYLVGLAVTDDPASLGTEYLEFCRTAKHNPLNRFKLSPENLISVATPVELEFEDLPETVFTALTEKVKSIFGRKQASDDARLNDVHEAVTAVAEHVQEKLSATEQRLAEMETAFSALKQDVTDRADETSQAFTRLKNSLDNTESLTQQRRSKATGGVAGAGDGAGDTNTNFFPFHFADRHNVDAGQKVRGLLHGVHQGLGDRRFNGEFFRHITGVDAVQFGNTGQVGIKFKAGFLAHSFS